MCILNVSVFKLADAAGHVVMGENIQKVQFSDKSKVGNCYPYSRWASETFLLENP